MINSIKKFLATQTYSVADKIEKTYNESKISFLPYADKSYIWLTGAFDDTKWFISKQAEIVYGQAKKISVESTLAVTTVLSSEWAHNLAQYLADVFNKSHNIYDKAIDAVYNSTHIGGSQLHHLVDGQHTIIGAFQAAKNASVDDSFFQEIWGTAEHLFRDTMSVSGINPLVSISKDTYDSVAGFLSNTFYIPRSWTSDMLTINGPEVIASAFAVLPLIFGWSKKETERFGELAGLYGISAIISANPLLGIISLVALARAYTQAKNSSEKGKVVTATVKGGVFSTITIGVSSIIGGPVWMGLILGIVIAFIVRKKLNDQEFINTLTEFLQDFYNKFIYPNITKVASELVNYYQQLRINVTEIGSKMLGIKIGFTSIGTVPPQRNA